MKTKEQKKTKKPKRQWEMYALIWENGQIIHVATSYENACYYLKTAMGGVVFMAYNNIKIKKVMVTEK